MTICDHANDNAELQVNVDEHVSGREVEGEEVQIFTDNLFLQRC